MSESRPKISLFAGVGFFDQDGQIWWRCSVFCSDSALGTHAPHFDREFTGRLSPMEVVTRTTTLPKRLQAGIEAVVREEIEKAWDNLMETLSADSPPATIHHIEPDTTRVTTFTPVAGPDPLSNALIAEVEYELWIRSFFDSGFPKASGCRVGIDLRNDGKLSMLIDDTNLNRTAQNVIMAVVRSSLTDQHWAILREAIERTKAEAQARVKETPGVSDKKPLFDDDDTDDLFFKEALDAPA